MNVAALLAMLLQTGICAQTEFHGPDGATLSVVVCPLMHAPSAEDAPEKLPEAPRVPERRT